MIRKTIVLMAGAVAILFCVGYGTPAGADADGEFRLVLKGYDPVAYFTAGEPTPGKPEFEAVFDRARYRFASGENMALFESDPERYAPQYGGSCTMGMSFGMKVEADPMMWRIIDDKLYVFAGETGPEHADEDASAMIEKADSNWERLASTPY